LKSTQLLANIDIRQLLKRSSNAFPAVNPLHTGLVKECQDVLLLSSKIVKAALVKPFIKIKSSLDDNVLNNYRSVSNLMFLFKIRKTAIAFRPN